MHFTHKVRIDISFPFDRYWLSYLILLIEQNTHLNFIYELNIHRAWNYKNHINILNSTHFNGNWKLFMSMREFIPKIYLWKYIGIMMVHMTLYVYAIECKRRNVFMEELYWKWSKICKWLNGNAKQTSKRFE